MPFAELPGVRLFYTDEGEGDPVVLVHGYTCDGNDWAFQIPALVPRYRVITVDLRGHGKSSVPESGYTPGQYADDIAALVRALGLPPVVAIGHSMGAATVSALAVRHPDLVCAIVPVDSAVGLDAAVVPVLDQFLAGVATPAAHEVVAGFFRQRFYPPASPPFLAAWHVRRVMAMPQHVLLQAFEGMFKGPEQFCVRPAADDYLAKASCPALVFRAGNQDPAEVARWEASLYRHPRTKAVGWEGSGHFLHQERPAEFNALLLAWLEGLNAE